MWKWVGVVLGLVCVCGTVSAEEVPAGVGFETQRADSEQIAQSPTPILEKIEVEGLRGTRVSYVTSRLELASPVGAPLNLAKLEDALRLLENDPIFEEVRGNLRPGSAPNQSILRVVIKEARRVGGAVSFDNNSPPAVGSERYSATVLGRSVTGNGDILAASVTGTFRGGSQTYEVNYRLPVNARQGTVSVRYAHSDYRIIQEPFDVFDFRGVSDLVEASYRQPLWRSSREELALSVTYSFQQGQTFIFNDLGAPFGIGADAQGQTTTHVLRLGQDYVSRDRGGAWLVSGLLNIGLGGTQITEPDASFFSVAGQVQRVQVVSPNVFLVGVLQFQLAADPLLPSQQFVIGGAQSVRGYRQNVRSGDNGVRASLESRITVVREGGSQRPIFQVAPFVEVGGIWNHPGNPNPLPSQNLIAGVGAGFIWEPVRDLVIRVDGAGPLVVLRDRGNDLQDQAFYFSVGYRF